MLFALYHLPVWNVGKMRLLICKENLRQFGSDGLRVGALLVAQNNHHCAVIRIAGNVCAISLDTTCMPGNRPPELLADGPSVSIAKSAIVWDGYLGRHKTAH